MHIAIEGCSHGELDIIYNSVQKLEEMNRFKIDLLICCGDFQSVRNEKDLKCMAVPVKYMDIQDFYKYHSGEKVAPVLTIFIGGNHEASNYLQELPYGGWVAPNIYYLGYAGVVNYGGLRIGGLSGIYKGPDFLKGHYEKTPYNGDSIRSVYHVRNLEVFRLKQLSGSIDIFMSHDWPRGIYHYGNKRNLISKKRHFKDEIERNTLGSRPAEELIHKLQPSYWFSGHLHVKFAAKLKHENTDKHTKFLALDKCLPRREFLQVLQLDSDETDLVLKYDSEWLTILRLTNHLLSVSPKTNYMPGPNGSEKYRFTPSKEDIEETVSLMNGDLSIPPNFKATANSFDDNSALPPMNDVIMPHAVLNSQTISICEKLDIDDPVSLLLGSKRKCPSPSGFRHDSSLNKSELEITLNASSSSVIDKELSDEDITSGDIIFEMNLTDDLSPIIKSPVKESDGKVFSSSPIRRTNFIGRKLKLSLPTKNSPETLLESTVEGKHPISNESNGQEASEISNDNESSNNASSSDSILASKEPNSQETTKRSNETESSINTSTPDTPLNPPTTVKKFKRRNQAIYSPVDD